MIFSYRLLIISLMLLNGVLYGQISGKITDSERKNLSFITIFDSTYQHHTVSNIDGDYELDLPNGNHKIFFQYLGYKTYATDVYVSNKPQKINVTLQKESYVLPEVTITDDGEDPAYGIIRKAIKQRNKNQYPVENYMAKVYSKGAIKLVDAPKKIFGQDVGDMGGMIDSTKQGIIYLSESVGEVSYSRPNYFNEKILASKVSGDPRGISINSFTRSNFTLYDETTDFSRNMISPIADNALSYYKYKLITTFIDEAGYKVYKIFIYPKSEYSQTYHGEINIVDEKYNIHSFNIFTTASQLRSPMIDTLRLMQLYKPIEKDKWCIITQNIEFKVKFFGFKAQGYFNYIFLNYDLNHVPIIKKAEVLTVDVTANKKDSIYWNEIRPIPLTEIESKDYIKKDSLNLIWNSKAYKDSLDRVNNKFKFNKLFFGYTFNNSSKNYKFSVNSPINSLQFNPIEGYRLKLPVSYTKSDTNGNNTYTIESFLQYGLSDEKFKYGVRTTFNLDRKSLTRLTLTYTDRYEQFDETNPIGDFSNTVNSLFYKQNYARFYDRRLVKASFQTEVLNGFLPNLTIAWDERKSLENTTNFSYRRKEFNYKPNNIRSLEGYSLDDHSFTVGLDMRFRIGQKYMSLPDDKIRMTSSWPTIHLLVKTAIPLAESYASFTKTELRVYKNYMPMNKYGFGKFNIKAGMFLQQNNVQDPDLLHVKSNDLLLMPWSNNTQYFRNMPFYTLSSNKPYASIFYEHNFEGFLTDKIPFIRRAKIQLTSNFAAHIRDDIRYSEIGVGLDGLSIGPLKLLKLDYVHSFGFRTDDMASGRIRLVFNDLFNFDTGF